MRVGGKKVKIEIDSSIWREEIQNRNRLPIVSSIWREEIPTNRILDLAGRIEKSGKSVIWYHTLMDF
jgi:hypothetical protein